MNEASDERTNTPANEHTSKIRHAFHQTKKGVKTKQKKEEQRTTPESLNNDPGSRKMKPKLIDDGSKKQTRGAQ